MPRDHDGAPHAKASTPYAVSSATSLTMLSWMGMPLNMNQYSGMPLNTETCACGVRLDGEDHEG